MPIAVPLIAAGVGAAGSVYAANQASKGQKAAAQASQAATDQATAEQRRQYDQSRADNAPWLQTGQGALSQLAGLYGIGQPGQPAPAQAGRFDAFMASPDYQFRQSEQARALTARNAALGIQDSGAAQRSAMQLSGNLASGEFNNYANRLAALAGVGQTAAGQNQQLGQNYAGAVGNLAMNNAGNLASSYQNQGAINGQLGQQIAGMGSGLIMNNAKTIGGWFK